MRGPQLLLLLGLVTCVSCRRGPDSSPPERPLLTVATRADVTGIFPNPPYQAEIFSIDVNANIYDSLVRFDRDLRILPGLAEQWENPDELTWVFRLRKDGRFSNGDPVLASDVVASLRMSITRNTPLLPSDRVEAEGPDRVVIRTSRPSPHLLAHLQSAFVLPAKALTGASVPTIGSGPYRLGRWTPGRELLLERNPYFQRSGAVSGFDRVRLEVMPAAKDRIHALLTGRAQVADAIPPEEIAALERESGVRVVSEPSLRVLYLAFRVDRRPFSDLRVRRAVRLALDPKELIKRTQSGLAAPANQLVPPQVFGYSSEIPESTPDLPAARRLLLEAGYPSGLDVQLDGPNDRYVNDGQILEEVRRQLDGAGIRVTVDAMPKSRYYSRIRGGGSSFFLMGWVCNTLFGGDALEALIRTRGAAEHGTFNYQGISDPDLDRLTEEGLQSASSQTRLDAIQKAMALVNEKELVVPLVIPFESIAISRDVAWEPEKGLALRFAAMRPDPARRAAKWRSGARPPPAKLR